MMLRISISVWLKIEHSIYNQTISQCLKSLRLKRLRDKLENILYESTHDIFAVLGRRRSY